MKHAKKLCTQQLNELRNGVDENSKIYKAKPNVFHDKTTLRKSFEIGQMEKTISNRKDWSLAYQTAFKKYSGKSS